MSRDREHPDLPPEAGELELTEAEAERLRDVLRAAWAPAELTVDRQRALLDRALGETLPSAEEAAAAAALERALASDAPHPDVDLARALRAAAAPRELAPARADELLQRALAGTRTERPRNVLFVVFGAAGAALALAAAVALVIRGAAPGPDLNRHAHAHALALSRSTAPLFTEKFSATGNSERVGLIAVTRERELRQNQFARWGVR